MYCTRCRALLQEGAKFCSDCGEWVGRERIEPAPLERRFVAFLIDGPVVWALAALVGLIWGVAVPESEANERALFGLVVLVVAAYYVVCWATWNTSVGKRIMGLRLVTNDGERPGFGRALARFVVMFLLSTLWITWWPVFGQSRRAIHDRVAGVRLVRARKA